MYSRAGFVARRRGARAVVPWSQEMLGAVNGVMAINYWNWNSTGNPNEFTSLSNMVASNANQVLALTRRDPNIMNVTGLTSLNELGVQSARQHAFV